MTHRRTLLVGAVAVLGLLVIGTLVIVERRAEEREREVIAAMRSDPVWQLRPRGTTVVQTDLVDGCGPRTTVGYRTSTQRYESNLAPGEIEAMFRAPLEALGRRPALLPTGWEKQIGGRTYQLSLGLHLPGTALLTMTSPGDMCQTSWL